MEELSGCSDLPETVEESQVRRDVYFPLTFLRRSEI